MFAAGLGLAVTAARGLRLLFFRAGTHDGIEGRVVLWCKLVLVVEREFCYSLWGREVVVVL